MRYLFARERFIKTDPASGSIRVFAFGDRVDADDPIVAASPGDFVPVEQLGLVEQTTAAPGERRRR